MIFVFTLALAWAGAWWLPWWWVAAAAGLVAFWRLRSVWRLLPQAFGAGALAWFLPALWRDFSNEALLSRKMAVLFHLPGPWGILAITSLMAGILAVCGALIGQRLRRTAQSFIE